MDYKHNTACDIVWLLCNIEYNGISDPGLLYGVVCNMEYMTYHTTWYCGALWSIDMADYHKMCNVLGIAHNDAEYVYVYHHAYYVINNIGYLERTLEYYYHATPGEPCKGSPGIAW